MRKSLRIGVVLLILGGLVFGAGMLVLRKKRQLMQAPKFGLQPRPVTVVEAKTGAFREERHYLAVVKPARQSVLTASVTAEVVEVLKDEGDAVKAGELLVKLDDREMRQRVDVVGAQIEQARAELAANKATVESLEITSRVRNKDLERTRALAKKGVTTPAEVDKSEAEAAEAEGRLRAAREQNNALTKRVVVFKMQKEETQATLTHYAIISPYAGIVSERHVNPGDLASPQKPLMRVEDRSALKLVFDVPQTDLPAVRQGLSVRFNIETESRTAMLTLLFPSLNAARMKRAEVSLSENAAQRLSPGATLSVSVVLNERNGVTLIPRASLIESPQSEPYVFVVKNGFLSARNVKLLGFVEDQAAVEGVSSGEQVVRNTFLGWARLSSGEKVEAIR